MSNLSNKTKAIIAVISILAIIGVSGIIEYFTDTVTNNVKMGIVDIDLKEYMINENGNKVEWQDKTNEKILLTRLLQKVASKSRYTHQD